MSGLPWVVAAVSTACCLLMFVELVRLRRRVDVATEELSRALLKLDVLDQAVTRMPLDPSYRNGDQTA